MIMRFTARLLDGRILTSEEYASIALLPLDEVIELNVQGVTLYADVATGERVHFFTRHTVPVGNPDAAKLSVSVFEIRKDEKTLCRLYWHPEKGPLLTSQDLYF